MAVSRRPGSVSAVLACRLYAVLPLCLRRWRIRDDCYFMTIRYTNSLSFIHSMYCLKWRNALAHFSVGRGTAFPGSYYSLTIGRMTFQFVIYNSDPGHYTRSVSVRLHVNS